MIKISLSKSICAQTDIHIFWCYFRFWKFRQQEVTYSNPCFGRNQVDLSCKQVLHDGYCFYIDTNINRRIKQNTSPIYYQEWPINFTGMWIKYPEIYFPSLFFLQVLSFFKVKNVIFLEKNKNKKDLFWLGLW